MEGERKKAKDREPHVIKVEPTEEKPGRETEVREVGAES